MADQPAPRLPFWIHQVVEYLLGLLLISQAIQSEHPEVPVVLGVGVILLAATADGPLAAFHVVPRPLHRVLDVVAIVAIAVATIVFRDDLGGVGVVFAAAVVVAMAGLVVRTSYAPKSAKPRRAVPPPVTATATPQGTATAPPPAVALADPRPAPATSPAPEPPTAPAMSPAPEPPSAPAPPATPAAPAPATRAAPATPTIPATPTAPAAPAPERAAPAPQRSKGEVYSRAAGRALGTGIRSYRGRKAAAPPPAPPPAAAPAQDKAPRAPADADGESSPPLPPPSSP